jgi:prefoldin subunit 5
LPEKVQKVTGAEDDYETLVDIGQGCYMQAVVPKGQDSVFVHIGLGFFTEISPVEIPDFTSKRVQILRDKISHTEQAIEKVANDIAEVGHALSGRRYLVLAY